jgi:hypothetical protein
MSHAEVALLPTLLLLLLSPCLVKSWSKCCAEHEVIDLHTKECVTDPRLDSEGANGTVAVALNITNLEGQEFYGVMVPFRKFSRQTCASEARLNLLKFRMFLKNKSPFVMDKHNGALYRSYCLDHVIDPDTGSYTDIRHHKIIKRKKGQ